MKKTEPTPEKNTQQKTVKPLAEKQRMAEKKDKPSKKVVTKEESEPNESNAVDAVSNWRSPVGHARSTSKLKKLRSVT